MTAPEEIRREIDRIDQEMAALFAARLRAAEAIAACKREAGLPVCNPEREAAVLAAGAERFSDPTEQRAYLRFLSDLMATSRAYQHEKLGDLHVNVGRDGYDILTERGGIHRVGERFSLNRRVLIVTDDRVPSQYAATVRGACGQAVVATLPHGEGSKTLSNAEKLCRVMLQHGFTRADCVVAVGGGMVGDLAALAAGLYMRGIDFYNVPTTLLAQADASVGGKCAANLGGVKNPVGLFRQPCGVLIDPGVLETLPAREYAAGMAEIIKIAATHDAELFAALETMEAGAQPDAVLLRAVRIKKAVVEADEREAGERRALNFGHTIGHAVEALSHGKYLHGECVAMGMLPMCAPAVRARIRALNDKFGLPTAIPYAPADLAGTMARDKKGGADGVTYVWVEEIGTHTFRTLPCGEMIRRLTEGESL